jgi:trigger factor
MQHELKRTEKSTVEVTITVPPADYKKNMETAAVRLSERAAIKGFRPGKAPYELVKQEMGEIRILEEAMQSIVETNFFKVVAEEKLDTIGMPQITLEKFAPGNDLVFKATAALLPKVTLPNLATIKVESKPVTVGKEQIDETMNNLRKMQGKEVIKTGAATKDDKVVVNMEMFIDKVPVEGGQAPNHQVYLSEPHYIPGFAEELVGLKKDDAKEFSLKFPKEHYQKHLAGKNVDFAVKVNEVYELSYPEINDEFAKALGQKSLEKMVELLTANLTKEGQRKEDERFEIALLEQLIEKSTFEVIPDVLIDAEKNKMFYELKHNLEEQGIPVEKYLADLKKTEAEILADFTAQADKRAKAALISRQLALDNNIKVEPDEINTELAAIRAAYPNNPQVEENLKRQEVIHTIATTLQNKKVIQWAKQRVTQNV